MASGRGADDGSDGGERTRVGRVYRDYGSDPRKRRRWSAENPGNRAIRAELVSAVFALAGTELARAGEILDVGCGSGWWLERLAGTASVHGALHGVELLDQRVNAARERVPSATVVAGDARRLPFTDRRFGLVSLFTVLSSLPGRPDVTQALREAARVLAHDGALVVWEPRVPTPGNRSTVFVSRALVRGALASMTCQAYATTLLPPLARRLGRGTERLYPLLVSIPILRTHRLTCARFAK
jgi:ubiquinone/menaquinone biosynthesis C-methylase UbiE